MVDGSARLLVDGKTISDTTVPVNSHPVSPPSPEQVDRVLAEARADLAAEERARVAREAAEAADSAERALRIRIAAIMLLTLAALWAGARHEILERRG